MNETNAKGPIGIFDSGYGGLTVLKEILEVIPDYNYIYLGDNARTPYGSRSFDTIYRYTLEAVNWLFDQGCPLVILACNTASAKALRNIQQLDLHKISKEKRLLGVIRPVTESVINYTKTKKIGILGTKGTIQSGSYPIEINRFFPEIEVFQQSCPMWVPLIENNEHQGGGADYFVKKYLDELMGQCSEIDSIVLACTHYPLLIDKIRNYLGCGIQIVSQGKIVAISLANYLVRHPEIESKVKRNSEIQYFTTDTTEQFNNLSSIFLGKPVNSIKVSLV